MKIIIEGYNKSIHKKANQIIIKEKEEIIYKISAKKVSDILILAKGYVTFDALTLLSQNNIPLISTNKYGQIEYILYSYNQENILIKKKQYKLSENNQGIKIAKEIIKSKMNNQYYTIKTLNKNKKNKEVKEITAKIKRNLKKLETIEINEKQDSYLLKNTIMGIEGITSSQYWKAISLLLPQKTNFSKREHKGNDIVNAMLNYSYAILASEITKIIILEKLDPYCGFLHSDLNKRTSLTYDLIEEYRQQIVDKTVFSLINRKQITSEDIDKRTNMLKKESKYILTKSIMNKINTQINYNDEKLTYYQIMQKQVNNFKKAIEKNEEYKSFKIKW